MYSVNVEIRYIIRGGYKNIHLFIKEAYNYLGGKYMGRKPKPEEDRKIRITLRISKKVIDKLRLEENYNAIVQKLIENYLNGKK